MKTILRVMIILLVESIVAGAFSLAVNNNTIASSPNEGGQPLAMTRNNDQTTTQPMARPEGGDRDEKSIAGGVAGIFATLLKLTGITLLVLVLQKGFNLLGNRRLVSIR